MKYDHILWDSMLKILQHSKERLMFRGNSTMCAEIDKVYQSAINDFTMPLNQLAWALHFICTENELLPGIGLDVLNADERKAVEDEDLKATSTEAGHKAVRIAHKRLVKAEKMRPVTEAKQRLDKANELKAEKKRLADEAKVERDRPERELSEAEKETRQASADLKQAEREVGV